MILFAAEKAGLQFPGRCEPVFSDLSLTIRKGDNLRLTGPSGSGKTSLMRMIAGLEDIDSGDILVDGTPVQNLRAAERDIAFVFQNYALYPHLTVAENIAFPLEVRGDDKAEIEREVRAIAELTHIEELLARRPAQLSGGQQQRVALARALVRKPDVLLLDEPLANLDAKLRLEMRSEIRRIQLETGITAILVTHDQVEAMSMCDRIAIMNKGEILQIATPTDMYRAPVNKFVAGFLGNPPIVMLEGKSSGDGRFIVNGGAGLPLPSRLANTPGNTPLSLGVRPEHFGAVGASQVAGTITFVEPQGRETLFDVTLEDGVVLRSIQPAREDVALGHMVAWPLDAEKLLAFDASGQAV
ncbi:ABC transporter ATP-binding protein [uncultured Nitratireductor sp.]|uniref:ABC transporter ATP-binding protein n=1 Tax=uncultured Nitratireductor sp. TaxID=520953 RepID=UPI0025FE27FF|nr:ABC transporter ATP-binding protein [uncultured Nitratireductor sp.]